MHILLSSLWQTEVTAANVEQVTARISNIVQTNDTEDQSSDNLLIVTNVLTDTVALLGNISVTQNQEVIAYCIFFFFGSLKYWTARSVLYTNLHKYANAFIHVGCWKCHRHSWWSIWLAWRCCPGAIFCVCKDHTHKHNQIKAIWTNVWSFPVSPLHSLRDPCATLGNSATSTRLSPEAGKSSHMQKYWLCLPNYWWI